jgi:hypothetical protein
MKLQSTVGKYLPSKVAARYALPTVGAALLIDDCKVARPNYQITSIVKLQHLQVVTTAGAAAAHRPKGVLRLVSRLVNQSMNIRQEQDFTRHIYRNAPGLSGIHPGSRQLPNQ